MYRILFAGLAMASLGASDGADVLPAESRLETPFSVTMHRAEKELRRSGRCGEFVEFPSVVVRIRNRTSSSIWIDRWDVWTHPHGKPCKFEAWIAPTDEWRELPFIAGQQGACEIQPGASHAFPLGVVVFGEADTRKILEHSRLRVTLDYHDAPERNNFDRKQIVLPVRFLHYVEFAELSWLHDR